LLHDHNICGLNRLQCRSVTAPHAIQSQWLDEEEMFAWRHFIETVGPVLADIDADLMSEHGLTSGDYEVFVHLSEAPDRAMRMCDLADKLRLSPSGLTRRLDGLVKLGYIVRGPCPDDRRATLARLTDVGLVKHAAAAADHVAHVRRRLLGYLSREELLGLGNAFVAIKAGRASSEHESA
jgi:DNA-binding MarR family transcriptional regulator